MQTETRSDEGHEGEVRERSIEVREDIFALAWSANGKWVAVGMLDATCALYFEDSLKFNINFYGHKLPILCLDLTDDSQMLATGSADKTLKLWSTNFGNCFRSLHAHDDSVMCCRFVRNTHYLVTASKDRTVKLWDCDAYEMITVLGTHAGEVWGL